MPVNNDQLKQLGAMLLSVLCTYLISSGYLTSDQGLALGHASSQIVDGVMTLIGVLSAAYSAWKLSHKQSLATAAGVPGVTAIQVDMAGKLASKGAIAAVNDNTGALVRVVPTPLPAGDKAA
jgi:hypothetical protein